MAGANYMGGKRNAAKARNRDAISRLQKGFFGRRRLEILSKGLAREDAISTSTGNHEPKFRPVVHIDLGHAKRTSQLSPRQNSIPYPRFPQHTPVKDEFQASSVISTARTGSRSSKVLDVLDISDPLSRRAMLDRILSLSDLACLPSLPRHGKRSAPQECSSRLKRQKTLYGEQGAPCAGSGRRSSSLGQGDTCSDRHRQRERTSLPADYKAREDNADACMRGDYGCMKGKFPDVHLENHCMTMSSRKRCCEKSWFRDVRRLLGDA